MGSSPVPLRQLDGAGPLPVRCDRASFRPGTPCPAAPGTTHVAYGRRSGGSTEGYRTVAPTQHSGRGRTLRFRAAWQLTTGHEEAAPLSRRRFVERACLPDEASVALLVLAGLGGSSLGLRCRARRCALGLRGVT